MNLFVTFGCADVRGGALQAYAGLAPSMDIGLNLDCGILGQMAGAKYVEEIVAENRAELSACAEIAALEARKFPTTALRYGCVDKVRIAIL